ncbi:MAG: GLPGLI family protein [Muribaculaceae bacterium]
MHKILMTFVSLLAFVSAEVSAQLSVSYMMDTPSFTLAHEDTDKSQTLDTCYLTVTYRLKYKSSEKDDSLSYDDLMDLQLGRGYNAFFSRNLRDLDIKNTKELKSTMMFQTIPENYVGFDLLVNHDDSTTIVTNRVPYTTQVIEYTENTPVQAWTYLPGEKATVMGYDCNVAKGNFGGREWKIYYTDAIPLPYGPWKLNGAKGLILKAEDAGNNFVFEAEGLTQKPQPIIRYDWKRKVMKKDDWKRFEQDIYKNAGAFVRNTGARVLITDNSEKGFHKLNEEWSQFYNPLEK